MKNNDSSLYSFYENNHNLQFVKTDYQILLLTFYNSICNNLNNTVGDKSTIESIHKMIDTEMNSLLKTSNMKFIKMKGENNA